MKTYLENFNLTGQISQFEKVQSSRLVGAALYPLASAVDAVAHAALFSGKLAATTAALPCRAFSPVSPELHYTSAFVHLNLALESLVHILSLTLLAVVNPEEALRLAGRSVQEQQKQEVEQQKQEVEQQKQEVEQQKQEVEQQKQEVEQQKQEVEEPSSSLTFPVFGMSCSPFGSFLDVGIRLETSIILSEGIAVDEADCPEAFKSYLEEYCPGVAAGEALRYAARGEKFLKIVRENRSAALKNSQKRECMASLVWYLMFIAVEQKKGFSQGTFRIEDPGFKVFDYFRRFQGPDSSESEVPVFYLRASSHFPGITPEGESHYGIDIHEGCENSPAPLPADKRTVVFQCLADPASSRQEIYIKPEDFGCKNLREFLLHGADWVRTRFVKPEQKGFQKEHPPQRFLDRVRSIAEQVIKDEGVRSENIERLFKDRGVAGIYRFLQSVLNQSELLDAKDEALITKVQAFKEELEKRYANDVSRIKGNEVVVSASDLEIKRF